MVSIYPTGTTLYDPGKCWNGYTLLGGGHLIDMNGEIHNTWPELMHAKFIPDGQVLARIGP